jgi:asparagine synthetase B (glutamine-hydrolysing)
MPGLVGWLNGNESPLEADACALLSTNRYHAIEPVEGVRRGQVRIAHPQINPLGHGRLADEGTGRLVAFWGEFYGPEFDRCMTGAEVCATLLRLLADEPLTALRDLDGSFTLFWQDRDSQLLVADRTGSRPLYYMESGGSLVFAPELKVFSRLRRGKPPLNHDAMVSFLVNGHPLSDSSYYTGVRLLRPGWCLEARAQNLSSREYAPYTPACADGRDRGPAAYREELAATLRAAVRKRSRGIEKAVFPISGGYDSRGLLACVREFYSGPLCTVSWGTDEDHPAADAAIGRKVAEHLGCNHRFLRRRADGLLEGMRATIQLADAGNSDGFNHPHEPALIGQLREEGHPILFRGDECFGYLGPALSGMEAMARVGLRELSHYPSLFGLFHSSVLPGVLERQRDAYQAVIDSCPARDDWTIAKDWLYLRQRLFRSLNFSHYAKLAFVEARNPWLDRDVLRVFESVPVKYRLDKTLYRETLAFMFPDVMSRIPIAMRNSLENWAGVIRADRGFERSAREHLMRAESPIHAIWSPAAIGAWIDHFYAGQSSEPAYTRLIDTAKSIARKNLKPLYRMLKKAAPKQLSVRPFPPEDVIGRLLILKLWCDRWG